MIGPQLTLEAVSDWKYHIFGDGMCTALVNALEMGRMRIMCFSSIFLLFLVAVAIISAADQWEKEVEVVELDTKAINSDHQLADNKEMKPLQQEEVAGKTKATSCLETYKVFQPNLDFFKEKEDEVEVDLCREEPDRQLKEARRGRKRNRRRRKRMRRKRPKKSESKGKSQSSARVPRLLRGSSDQGQGGRISAKERQRSGETSEKGGLYISNENARENLDLPNLPDGFTKHEVNAYKRFLKRRKNRKRRRNQGKLDGRRVGTSKVPRSRLKSLESVREEPDISGGENLTERELREARLARLSRLRRLFMEQEQFRRWRRKQSISKLLEQPIAQKAVQDLWRGLLAQGGLWRQVYDDLHKEQTDHKEHREHKQPIEDKGVEDDEGDHIFEVSGFDYQM